MKSNRQGSAGFSLIEILVAVLLFATSVLGLAQLLLASLKASNNAYLRSQAIAMAYDINDRMRANLPAALAGDYGRTEAQLRDAAASVATTDLSEWRDRLSAVLPEGQGSIQVDAATRMVAVTIEWQDNSFGDNEDQTSSGATNAALIVRTGL